MIRTKPNSPVNFEANEEGIVKLFNEYDRCEGRVHREKNATPDEARILSLSETSGRGEVYQANFQLVTALAQMPHLNALEEMGKRAGRPLTAMERGVLQRRIRSAEVWVDRYAADSEKTRLQEVLPESVNALSEAQRGFLLQLSEALKTAEWEGDALQACVFETARMTPIEQPVAFKAIYKAVLNREMGPKAGNLFAYLSREFLVGLLSTVAVDRPEFLRTTAVGVDTLREWVEAQRAKAMLIESRLVQAGGVLAQEFLVVMEDGKRHVRRVLVADEAEGGLIAASVKG
jgi:lysyl-tRNA synthetase class 1